MQPILLDLLSVSLTTALFLACSICFLRFTDTSFKRGYGPNTDDQISFLICGDDVLDASAAGHSLLQDLKSKSQNRSSVLRVLQPSFPTISDVLADDETADQILESPEQTGQYLHVSRRGTATQLVVKGVDSNDLLFLHQIRSAKNTTELDALRSITENSNELIWTTTVSDQLDWANSTYLAVADRLSNRCSNSDIATMPANRPFQKAEETIKGSNRKIRVSLPANTPTEEDWFELSCVKSDQGHTFYATGINDIVRLERSQKNFFKTISQTFAQLSIGLAIFDRRRQLSTFNPALIDLTSLSVEFLSGRPSLDMVLDQLRETQMLPEPKNYPEWREEFSRLEAQARNGTYCENWNLPDGQTYRVTGRPHLDGAFALLFEDISAEISLTRRFRTEIETSQVVLDKMNEAIVIFSSSGNLVMSNRPYEELWDATNNHGILQSNLRSEIDLWKARCAPTRFWQGLRRYIKTSNSHEPWAETVLLDDGRSIQCRAEQISGGMTMVRFSFDTGNFPSLFDVSNTIALTAKG